MGSDGERATTPGALEVWKEKRREEEEEGGGKNFAEIFRRIFFFSSPTPSPLTFPRKSLKRGKIEGIDGGSNFWAVIFLAGRDRIHRWDNEGERREEERRIFDPWIRMKFKRDWITRMGATSPYLPRND